MVCDKAKVTLENNNIESNTLAGVQVGDEGSEAVLRDNHIHDGKEAGVCVFDKAKATLESNHIEANDLNGVCLFDHATASLVHNRIQGNGHATIERTETELADWIGGDDAPLYRSGKGFPGVAVQLGSTLSLEAGSNTIEGNHGGDAIALDATSQFDTLRRHPRCRLPPLI